MTISCFLRVGTFWSIVPARRRRSGAWSLHSTILPAIDAENVTFDNKLNVLHRENAGLSKGLAKGLAVFLTARQSTPTSGNSVATPQVNASDLRSLALPRHRRARATRRCLGRSMPSQDEINQLVKEEIPFMSDADDPVEVNEGFRPPVSILKALKAPKEQRNERSALTLLGLLDLAPTAPWSAASMSLRGVTELMGWMATNYGKKYAPNTRETIRRFTLHQFIEMGLVVRNPDNPRRPPNSRRTSIRSSPRPSSSSNAFETAEWEGNLAAYVKSMDGKEPFAREARQMKRIRSRFRTVRRSS